MSTTADITGVRPPVLLVSPRYAPQLGGVENCTRELAIRLHRAGVVGGVLTSDPSWTLPPSATLDGVPVRRVRAYRRGHDELFAPAIAREVRSSGAGLVHVHGYQSLASPVAMAAAAHRGVPFVVTFHGGGHSDAWRNDFRARQLRILRPLLARAATLVATAEWEIEHYGSLLSLPRGRFTHIPNGADLPAVTGEVHPEPALIVSLGRAERYKGHHRVLEALPHVVRDVPEARVWIAGDGPYAGELRALAARLGVAERVEIGAEPDRRRYAARLARATVGTLLSDFETHPMGALEAISLGLPLLVADNSGLAELARDGLAQATPADAGGERHAAELVRLLRAPRRAAVELRLFSWDDCAAAHAALYASIAARPAGSRR